MFFKIWLESLEKLTNIDQGRFNFSWMNNIAPTPMNANKLNYYEADFKIGDLKYFVTFFNDFEDCWTITFGCRNNKNSGWGSMTSPYLMRTKEFKAMDVMQNVIAAMKTFVANVNPNKFEYAPNDEKLKRFYDRIKSRIIQEFPYKEVAPGLFVRN